jgi:glutathione peroxidase
MKVFIIGLLMLGILTMPCHAQAQGIYDFKIKTMQGEDQSLLNYKGQVLLIVNIPSHCGSTPQYTGLERLYERYKARGLSVLAFPANDFLDQDPNGNGTLKQFCELNFKASFPSFSQVSVKGPQMDPLFHYLTTATGGDITWNFNKFLIDRQGHVIARFDSKTDPMDPQLEEDVLRALAQ